MNISNMTDDEVIAYAWHYGDDLAKRLSQIAYDEALFKDAYEKGFREGREMNTDESYQEGYSTGYFAGATENSWVKK